MGARLGARPAMTSAVVVGSGPNGLAAAVTLARAGLEVTVLEATSAVGGGMRSGQVPIPGVIQDHCSAFHPMAVVSPLIAGLSGGPAAPRFRWAEVEFAHPLDDGTAPALMRSVPETAATLGTDAALWRGLFGSSSEHFPAFAGDLLGPVLRVPGHPLRLARFGVPALLPATWLARMLRTEAARSLFAGAAAHAMQPLTRPLTSAIAMGLITAAHSVGWPVIEGGTQRLAEAFVAELSASGVKIETGVQIRSSADLPPSDLAILDVSPSAAADILAEVLPPRTLRAYRRFPSGPAAFKVDFAVEGGIPWTAESPRRAGTVHLGGSFAEVRGTEREVAAGRMPERPFVLVGQQYLADPSRSNGTIQPVYAYAHVPAGYGGDATASIVDQIERFAAGFRDRIVASASTSPADFAATNANFFGGDILTGANTAGRLAVGPRGGLNPYRTGAPGIYLCSAATPPGPGAHGMCGYHAANIALGDLARGQSGRP